MYRKNLLELGIPADINGFELLNYAIEVYEPQQSIIALYERVAGRYGITHSQAARNMRHAISKTGESITVGQFVAKYKILWHDRLN